MAAAAASAAASAAAAAAASPLPLRPPRPSASPTSSLPSCRSSSSCSIHTSSFRTASLAPPSHRDSFFPSSFPPIRQRRRLRCSSPLCVLDEAPPAPEPSSFAAVPRNSDKPRNIWLSDVAVLWKKPYFLNRHWTGKDIVYASFMIVLHGLCLLAPFTFTWKAFGVFVLLYLVTGMLGITLSFHRNLSHKSFTLPKWLEYTFAYCGVLAMQGDPLEWVSSHRYHHQHCDTDKDPHSPYEGFWYSHMGWLLDYTSTIERVGARANIGDMAKDPFYKFIKNTYAIHPILMAVAIYAVGGLPCFIWGVVVRTVWVYHITWAVNSASHVWGFQTWKTGDLSRNNWWVALLAFGEGWHNNHHAFEYSARHGLEWWQLDPTWYCVLALEKMGLATKVKLPLKDHMERLALKSS